MHLYANHVATTSRAVLAFCEHENIDVKVVSVNLMEGQHHQAPFSEINPNRMLPFLEDDGFVLTESSAILRYLAAKTNSALYPTELKARARVDELVAWFEANLYKDFGFQYVYPQLFPHHSRGSQAANDATVEWGASQSAARLSVLDTHYLGDGRAFLTGDDLTIADLQGASILSLGDLVGCKLDAYPNVAAWYARVSSLPAWTSVNAAFQGFADSISGGDFVGLAS